MDFLKLGSSRNADLSSVKKSVSFILALFLLLSPVSSVFGNEVTTTEEAINNSDVAEDENIQNEVSNPDTEMSLIEKQQVAIEELNHQLKEGLITQEEYDSEMDELGEAPEMNSNLSGPEAIDPTTQTFGKYIEPKVSPMEGGLVYEYPIHLPPGRNNFTPDLKLLYNSLNLSLDSILGIGWSLNIPYIQRLNKKGIDQLYAEDRFISSLDGELVEKGGNQYVPRVEKGEFFRYVFQNDRWVVTDKAGTQYSFGSTTQARQDDPDDGNRIFTWILESITDTNGNVISYEYYKNGGQIYPRLISYGIVDIVFGTTTKSTRSTYTQGFLVDTKHKISDIEIRINDEKVYDYAIGYQDELLIDLLVTGYSSTTSLSLPPTEFTYDGIDDDTGWDGLDQTTPFDVNFNETTFADVNGDGLADAVISYYDDENINLTYLNTGTGWSYSYTWLLPSDFLLHTDSGNSANAQLVDINGDGLLDIVEYRSPGAYIYYNTGAGWDDVVDQTTPFGVRAYETTFADVNGDGLMDAVNSYYDGGNFNETYLNTGTGWSFSFTWQLPSNFLLHSDSNGHNANSQLVDINGDGLVDILEYGNPGSDIYYNKGDGWSGLDQTTTFRVRAYETTFADVNGDGLVDAVNSYYAGGGVHNITYLNTGIGWESVFDWVLPSHMWLHGVTNHERNAQLVDINGDGLVDIVEEESSDANIYYAKTLQDSLLLTLTNSQGGLVEIDYAVAQVKDNSNVAPLKLVVVDSIEYTSDDWSAIYNYDYEGADFYYGNPHDRRFAGFKEMSVTRPDGSITTSKYHQANGQTGNEPTDSYSRIGMVYEETTEDGSNNLYIRKRINYVDTKLATTSTSTLVSSTLTQRYDGTGSHTDTATEYVYDSYGNINIETQHGIVNGASDGTFTDSGSDKRIIESTYASNTSGYIVGLPSTEALFDQSVTKIKESRYFYDTLPLGSTTKGNLTKREDWISASTYLNTQWGYNLYGLKTSETNPRGYVTSYSYDTYNLYPATTTNALSQSIRSTYDYSSGKLQRVVDANGFTHEQAFDLLDRVTEIKEPRGTAGALVTVETNTYTDTSGAVKVKNTKFLNTATSTDTYTYLDGFGRIIQERKEIENSNQYAVRDFVYGKDKKLSRESLPYFDNGTTRSSATTQNKFYTTYTYDPLDRKIGIGTILGTTTISYNQLTETATDTLGHSKSYVFDAYNHLSSVIEKNGTSTYTTTYNWTPHDQLATTTDALGNIRKFTYDGLGRRLTAQDLHASADTSYGTWSYAYDAAGNLGTTTNPKSQVMVTSYDALNRPTEENFTGLAGVEATFSYDSCTNGKGYICTSKNASATTTRTYSGSGLIASESKTIATTTYTQSFTYDYQNNQTQITYPDNSNVKYTHNTAGQLEKIEQRENGGTYKDIISDFDYSPLGQVTYQLHGNGASTTNTYDDAELYRLRSTVTSATNPIGGPGDELRAIESELSFDLPTEEPVVSEIISENSTATEEVLIDDFPDEGYVEIPVSLTETPIQTEILIENTPTTTITDASTTTSELEIIEVPLPEVTREGNRIKNANDAIAFRKYHKERVAYLESQVDLPARILDSARYAKERFEATLLEEMYINELDGEIHEKEIPFVSWLIGHLKGLLSYLLPERVFAYVFGKEDFESCSSLPCSFSTDTSWGSVTASIDSTSKVSGVKSLKAVVTGEGSASLAKTGLSANELWVQFKIFIPSPLVYGPSGYFGILTMGNSNDSTRVWLSVEDYGSPRLTFGGDVLSYTDTGINLTQGATNTIEIRLKTSASVGDLDIWKNSTASSSPTYNGSGSLNTGSFTIEKVIGGMEYAPENGISTTYYDDYIIDSSFIGSVAATNTAPTAPSVLLAEGQTNPTAVTDSTPEFSAQFNDPNAGDSANKYRLQVSTSSSFTSYVWDSGTTTMATTSVGSRNPDISYAGTSLASSTSYYWRIAFMDIGGASSPWSTTISSFILASSSSGGGATSSIAIVSTSTSISTGWSGSVTKVWSHTVSGSNPLIVLTADLWQDVAGSGNITSASWNGSALTKATSTRLNGMASELWYLIATTTGTNNMSVTVTGDTDAIKLQASTFSGVATSSPLEAVGSATGVSGTPSISVTSSAIGNLMVGTLSRFTTTDATTSRTALYKSSAGSTLGASSYHIGTTTGTQTDTYTGSVSADWSMVMGVFRPSVATSSGTSTSGSSSSTQAIFIPILQDITYTYDSVGNITKIVDRSRTNAAATTTYAYDDLYRLTSASTTQASTTPYQQTYTYNALGNIITKSDIGTYSYNGHTGSLYANPHAPTTVNGTTYSYDQNGNLASTSASVTNTWDYRNRLTQAVKSAATTTYAYDVDVQRVSKSVGGKMTHYPSSFYEVSGGTSTKHIYIPGGGLVGTIEGTSSSTAKLFHTHLDHLGSTGIVTNDIGYTSQVLSYYPYGGKRVSNQYGSFSENNQFIGQDYDTESDLSYLNARYYNGSNGQFMSQDPVFRDIGFDLTDPQSMNSYSYARNNPIAMVDRDGEMYAYFAAYVAAHYYINSNPNIPHTIRQADFLATHPIAAYQIGSVKNGGDNLSSAASNMSINITSADFGYPDTQTQMGSERNALRHVIWQGITTNAFGSNIAEYAANSHEYNPFADLSVRNYSDGALADQTADLLNNQIGRSIATQNPGLSAQDIAQQSLDYFYKIGLYTTQRDSKGMYNVVQTRISEDQYKKSSAEVKKLNSKGMRI